MNAKCQLFSSDGIEPDIYAEDDLNHELGDVEESMLAAAIAHICGYVGEEQISCRKGTGISYPVEYGKSSIEIKNNL